YDIIESKGYSAKSYIIVTPDDYLLTVHRISPKKPLLEGKRNVVLLQHGLLDSAHTWINNLANQSLGFILSDMGYDVWLGNSRGSTYSQYHKSLDASNEEFWQFSWDDMAHNDLPATIDFVLNQTGKDKLFYIGHSQGTQIAFAKLNSDPVLRSKVAAMVALAPVAYLANVKSPIRFMSTVCKGIESVVTWFGRGRFLPSSSLMRFLGLFLCRRQSIPFVCSNIIYLLAGYDAHNTNTTRLPVYVAHTPAGTSVRNMSMSHGKFQAFDFGKVGNMFHYNQTVPPVYGLNNIDLPLKLYWGGDDWLAAPTDVSNLLDELPRRSYIRDMYLPYYNHLDFVWGLDAARVIYADILHFFKEFQ
ncbi:unnamed protein product, partial [Schistocephalus solidus]|uniref:Gastric triacylglycerol lipase n=1 Tax=Schistocephalus solidus TaxID=70667 RepID=A0A183T3G1_SCHSO